MQWTVKIYKLFYPITHKEFWKYFNLQQRISKYYKIFSFTPRPNDNCNERLYTILHKNTTRWRTIQSLDTDPSRPRGLLRHHGAIIHRRVSVISRMEGGITDARRGRRRERGRMEWFRTAVVWRMSLVAGYAGVNGKTEITNY